MAWPTRNNTRPLCVAQSTEDGRFLLGDHHLMAAGYFLCAWLDTISSLVTASLMLLANSNSQRLGNELVSDFFWDENSGKVVSGAGEIATGIAGTDTRLRGGVAHGRHHWLVPIVASAGMNDISIFFCFWRLVLFHKFVERSRLCDIHRLIISKPGLEQLPLLKWPAARKQLDDE